MAKQLARKFQAKTDFVSEVVPSSDADGAAEEEEEERPEGQPSSPPPAAAAAAAAVAPREKKKLRVVWLALVWNTVISAGHNCSSCESSRKAADSKD